jgi:hypothetical protein
MTRRRLNADGEWVDDDRKGLADSPWPLDPSEQTTSNPSTSSGGKLTVVGWTFIALAVGALFVAGIALMGLGLTTRAEYRFFGFVLGGGMLLVVGLAAAICRVLGFRFYDDGYPD